MKRYALLLGAWIVGTLTNASPLWTDYSGELNGWKESPWFGWFWSEGVEPGWTNSWYHGWVWLQGSGEEDMWMWDYDLEWVWSSRNVHPFYYVAKEGGWLYYYVNSRDPRWFYDEASTAWIQVGSGTPASAQTTPEVDTATASITVPIIVDLSDGTKVEMPPLNTPVGFTLGRENTTFSFGDSGLMTSGSTRTLEIGLSPDLDPELVLPFISIPVSELGSLDPETINLVRVETIDNGDGTFSEERSYLPVTYLPDGTVGARDFMMPQTLWTARSAAALSMSPQSEMVPENGTRADPVPRRKVKYIASSFSGSLNYNRNAQLVRMVADKTSPIWRKPYSELSEEEKYEEDHKWVQNVVVLVHGHNEEEKGGNYKASAERPWYFAYKRDVWTLFYKRFCERDFFDGEESDKRYLYTGDTTRFYEFVYPSYRGIFNDLDDQLASQLELALASQLGADMHVNVVIIAHSMGGLVSRAAIQKFSSNLDDSLRKVITWGSPHMGSPLVSLRYVLAADVPYDFNIPHDSPVLAALGPTTGIYTWGILAAPVVKSLIRNKIGKFMMDAPGSRDLRYVRRPMQETSYRLGLENLFTLSTAQMTPTNLQKYDLQNGSAIYNYNLQLMNQNDRHKEDGIYFPFYGKTSKRLELEKTDSFPYYRIKNLEFGTAQGATIMPFLVANPDEECFYPEWPTIPLGTAGESDGAVNVPSMAGMGIAKWGGSIWETDHEEYFGHPDANGVFLAEDKGESTARYTNNRMFGGESDPDYAYDRDGIMRPPDLTIDFGDTSRGYDYATSLLEYDIGYATEVVFLARLNFWEVDELFEIPFSIFASDGFGLAINPQKGKEAEVIPIEEVEIAPSELPLRTGIGYNIWNDLNDPQIMKGKLYLDDWDTEDQILYLQMKGEDGIVFNWPAPMKIHKRSPEGIWELDLSLDNNGSGNDRINNGFVNHELEFDADGMATLDVVEEDSGESFNQDGTGTSYRRIWTWTGTASIENNLFKIYGELTQEKTFVSKSLVNVGEKDELKVITEESVGIASIDFEARLIEWNWNLKFDSETEKIEKGYALNYQKITTIGGLVSEEIYEDYEGDLPSYNVDIDPPPEDP